MICRICKKELNQLFDPRIEDCGGDCLLCMAEIVEDPDAIKRLKEITNPKDWYEHFSHENGQYQNKCCMCDSFFIGHKRTPVCRECYYNTSHNLRGKE